MSIASFGWSVALLPVLFGLFLLRRPIGRLLHLSVRSLGGLAALVLLSPAAKLLGVTLGINWLNALVLGLLGVPGFGLLLMLQWLLQTP
ncbi:MAG: pro-sigmaK processing inhibitor BofA family protein [Oscillospiraceae bacterium]|nr:pro-sigmaK processing inhibitor BofA family protein [Oscillospiraceae bacterium]